MKRALPLLLLLWGPTARASVDANATATTCTVKGKLKQRVEVFSAPTLGVQLLTTTWQHERNYEVYEFPKDTATGRVRARSSRDVPGLRIDGYIAAKDFTFSAAKDQPVIVDHVWLTAGVSLRLFQTKNALEGDVFDSPIANTRTRIECADLRFGASYYPSVPKGTRMWFKNKTAKLLDAPAGKTIFTINLNVEPTSLHVISLKTQGLYQQIEIGDVVKVSGWVASADLQDQYGGSGLKGFGTKGMGGTFGQLMKPTMSARYDVDVYLAPGSQGPVAAVLEKDARVYATPVENGYSRISLYNHDATPPDGKDFYVLSSALQ